MIREYKYSVTIYKNSSLSNPNSFTKSICIKHMKIGTISPKQRCYAYYKQSKITKVGKIASTNV